MKYLDFDLRLWEKEGGLCRITAEAGDLGEASAEVRIDVDEPGLAELLRRLAERRTDEAALRTLGQTLFGLLFPDDVETLFQRAFGVVEGRAEMGLRLRLRIASPRLATLPWELLHSRLDDVFLATRLMTPVVRYVDLPHVRRELATALPLRILVAIPRGAPELPPVAADKERRIIDKALRGLERHAEVTWLHELHDDRRVTWTRIHEQLAEGEYHVFHFIGHGGFHGGRGHLALDGDDGEADLVADELFAGLFADHQAMKLVVLNACDSATLSSGHRLDGCAARLVKAGVPAVVAMQYGVRDAAALDFARSFYHSLFRSAEMGRVDVAVSQGRSVLAAKHPGQRELATPVLLMHTANGVLFVPEEQAGRGLAGLPVTARRRDTLLAALAESGSPPEVDRLRRRVRTGRRVARVGFAASLLAFALLWMGVLDLAGLESRAELLTMALGDAVADRTFSDELAVVTVEAGHLSPRQTRQRTAQVVRRLADAGARVVALDLFYGVGEDGGFAAEPEAGRELVRAVRDAAPATAVVVGARQLDGDGELAVPVPLRQAAAGVGHLCPETRMGLTRALPLTVAKTDQGGRRLPSMALAAYAAYRGATLPDGDGNGAHPAGPADGGALVLLADSALERLGVSEVEVLRSPPDPRQGCRVLAAGDVVSHRFLRLTPREAAERHVIPADEVEAVGERLRGKLVVVGLLGVDDWVKDLSGLRPGVFWQADAVNNLLRGVEIRPLSDLAQLPLLLLLAGAAALLRLRCGGWLGRALVAGVAAVFVAAVVWLYGSFALLINPAYHLVAMGFAWWWAGRAGDTWLR